MRHAIQPNVSRLAQYALGSLTTTLATTVAATLAASAPSAQGLALTLDPVSDQHAVTRADDHGPIGVMGDHMHARGEWMFSYRLMHMRMDGNRDGTDSVSTTDVLADFMVAPLEMTMQMHMVGGMYGWSDDLTLMAMVPYVSTSMDHVNFMAVEFETESDGVGDIKLGGLYRLHTDATSHAHLNLGVSVPTGSIDEEDVTPASGGVPVQLPYPMQLGSGTWDLSLGGTWTAAPSAWSYGAQALQTLRIGDNDHGYRLGNRTDVTAWVARSLGDSLSASLRLAGARWGDVHGSDDELGAMPTAPTKLPGLRGGKRVDLLLGVNAYASSGALAGHRLAFEVGAPLWEDLDGPQLSTEFVATIGWQYAP